MEQSSSLEANCCLATQEILCLVWKLKVYYSIHKNPSQVPILIKINPVHTVPPDFLESHFNIILPPKPRSYHMLIYSDNGSFTLSNRNSLFTATKFNSFKNLLTSLVYSLGVICAKYCKRKIIRETLPGH
jgi:hypothetical protein